MKTALIHHPIYQKHDHAARTSGNAARYEVVMNALKNDQKLWENLTEIDAGKSGERFDSSRAHAAALQKNRSGVRRRRRVFGRRYDCFDEFV
jgi:hypothetical protein